MSKFLLNQQAGQLHGELKTQVVTVSGGPTLVPPITLQGRKDFLLYNTSVIDTIFVGGSDVTPTIGIPVVPAGTFGFQAGRAAVWATASGSNVDVKIMEIS